MKFKTTSLICNHYYMETKTKHNNYIKYLNMVTVIALECVRRATENGLIFNSNTQTHIKKVINE